MSVRFIVRELLSAVVLFILASRCLHVYGVDRSVVQVSLDTALDSRSQCRLLLSQLIARRSGVYYCLTHIRYGFAYSYVYWCTERCQAAVAEHLGSIRQSTQIRVARAPPGCTPMYILIGCCVYFDRNHSYRHHRPQQHHARMPAQRRSIQCRYTLIADGSARQPQL